MEIKNYEDLKLLAKEFDVPVEDVLFIALNRYGVMYDTEDNRIRFYLKLNTLNEEFFFAVCVNTYPSPFSIFGKELFLDGEKVGDLSRIEKDTCTSTYFRKGNTAMTINSNSRSQCAGCKFCGTYKLDSDEDENLTSKQAIIDYYTQVMKDNNFKDLSDMYQITVCTGCFPSEDDLVEHLILLKKTLKQNFNFNGKINYIGSQLRSPEKLERIKEEIGDFSLYVTTEKFTGRERIMRPEKASLTFDSTIKLLDTAVSLGFTASILYILGLEDLDIVIDYFTKLVPHVNKFPDVQIYQDYTPEQESYRCEDAKDFRYYLKARKFFEEAFAPTTLKPRSWENYRSLYYTSFNHEKYVCERK